VDTIYFGAAFATPPANAAGANSVKRTKALTTAGKHLFFNVVTPSEFLFPLNITNQERLLDRNEETREKAFELYGP